MKNTKELLFQFSDDVRIKGEVFTPKYDIKTLIHKLEKECATGRKGYEGTGVDVDELAECVDEKCIGDAVENVLFNRILFEIDNIAYIGHEFVYDEDYNTEGWFSSEKQINTYIRRLTKFCKKYAPLSLNPEYQESVLREIEKL